MPTESGMATGLIETPVSASPLHPAKAVASVVTALEKSTLVVSDASVNQPRKVRPLAEGSAGWVAVPPAANCSSAIAGPWPSMLNETVTMDTVL